MSNLFIETVSVNKNRGYRINDPEFNETRFDDMGKLYKSLVKEYGRCTSKQYITVNDKPVQIGWVFEKREKYSDMRASRAFKHMSPKERDACSFIMETWVSVHMEKPTTVITPHFAKF